MINTPSWNIPRNCLAWLFISQIAVIAPHAQRLPIWVLLIYILCAYWRIMIFQGRWSSPQRFIKFLCTMGCFSGIYLSYQSFLGLEPTVALFISGFSLKLLEIQHRRDIYLLIFLAYFVCLTEFLFSQEVITVLYGLATVVLVTASLIALHQQDYQQLNFSCLKKSSLLFAQAVPLMLVLFIIFPRFEPFWSVPLPSHQAKTGMSDSMTAGDVSLLSQSSELAFRVEFNGTVPDRSQMYWRGLVLSSFDGRTWSQSGFYNKPIENMQDVSVRLSNEKKLNYTVIQEQTYQPWLFALPYALVNNDKVIELADFRLLFNGELYERFKYSVTSDPQAVRQPEPLSRLYQRLETSLPREGNEQARAFAEELFKGSGSATAYVENVLKHFREQPFVYTLKPPLLGDEPIDEFLFSTRRGFCEHYSSTFVFLMRAVGIPSRVVTGYMGGEVNPITGTVLVHQFDAHAWTEVWFEGEGWVRIDPTAAVSPLRIERGLEQALEQEGSFLADSPLSAVRYRNIPWLNRLRLQLDAYNYYWAKFVLQYRGETQTNFLEQLLGKVDPWRIALLILFTVLLAAPFVIWNLFKDQLKPRSNKASRMYLAMCRRLERLGFQRAESEGPIDFARRVCEARNDENDFVLKAEKRKHISAATRAFVTLNYEPISEDERAALLDILRKEIKKLAF